jgi:hypothetical protein
METNHDQWMHLDPREVPPEHWIGAVVGADPASVPLLGAELVSLPPSLLKTHALLIGSTGCGKTNALHHLVAQDILLGHSFCILDMRGDFSEAALELCVGRVPPPSMLVLDLRDKDVPFGFDPLSGEGEAYFRALGILDAVESESASWGVQLSETLRYALMLLAETGFRLTDLERLLTDLTFLLTCLDLCRSESVLSFFQRFAELSADKRMALAMPVLNKLAPLLATDRLRRILGHSNPIDLGAHLNRRGSVTLVSLSVDELHASGRMFGRIFLASLCRELFSRVGTPESRRNPVRLFVDEFEHFGTGEFETILAEGRRFGLSLILAHQTLAQLSTKMRSLILGNVGTKLVFRCGREDGPVLSRDLTGDPRAIDFAQFETGEAMLSNRSIGTVRIEINEPIIRDGGGLSRAARRFRDEINAYHASKTVRQANVTSQRARHQSKPAEPQTAPAGKNATPRPPRKPPALEDWL